MLSLVRGAICPLPCWGISRCACAPGSPVSLHVGTGLSEAAPSRNARGRHVFRGQRLGRVETACDPPHLRPHAAIILFVLAATGSWWDLRRHFNQGTLPGASLTGGDSPCWVGGRGPGGQSPAVCSTVPVRTFPAQVLHERLGHRAEVDVRSPAAAAPLQRWVPSSSQNPPPSPPPHPRAQSGQPS